jgi:hypothetical protein
VLSDNATPGFFDKIHSFVEVLRPRHRVGDAVDLATEVDRDDVCAFFGEPHSMLAALTTRGPGNEGNLTF